MIVKIEDVRIGARYQGKIYDFFIKGQLLNGNFIKIFDLVPYDLRKFIGKKIDLLLFAFIVREEKEKKKENFENESFLNIIEGKYIDEYDLQKESKLFSNSWLINRYIKRKWSAIQYHNEIFLLNPDELKSFSIEEGVDLVLSVGRFDLIAWRDI